MATTVLLAMPLSVALMTRLESNVDASIGLASIVLGAVTIVDTDPARRRWDRFPGRSSIPKAQKSDIPAGPGGAGSAGVDDDSATVQSAL